MVGCRTKVDRAKLLPNTRVALDVTTLTIMRILPREVWGSAGLWVRLVDGDAGTAPAHMMHVHHITPLP